MITPRYLTEVVLAYRERQQADADRRNRASQDTKGSQASHTA